MHHFARRTAGYTALIAAAGLIAAGCSSDDNSAGDAAASITSAAQGAGGQSGESSAEKPTESNQSGEPTTPGAGAAGQETKIATPNGEIAVSGGIYEKYVAAGGPEGTLGAPVQEQESAPEEGMYQDFTGGTIYQAKEGEPHIVWGEIRKAWEQDGGANGKLGYPTSDEKDIAGGKESDFSGGSITWVDGQTTVTPK